MPLSRAELARYIDHTLLAPTATRTEVAALLSEARDLGTYSVCVSPSMLPLAEIPAGLKVATVCGFPSGQHAPEIKVAEAARSVADGADEIDLVVNLGRLIEGDLRFTEAEIRAVKEAIGTRILKVIVESAALTDDQIVAACRCAEAAGADFVKTSTGFHPAGGASVHAVELMAATVGNRLGIKASGGIRDRATALTMIAAGATRLGLSGSRTVLDGIG